MAVTLLLVIAGVLAWGTMYETRFGTAAVQRFVYHAWWFQALLGFLALNLAVAAAQRYPWKRQHTPFVLAHLGIILILIGGILGGRFGIEGQLIIPEGQAERVLELPGNVLTVHLPNPGVSRVFPTRFETQAWVHEPKLSIPVMIEGRAIELSVDRYYPDAIVDERITDDGTDDNPALKVRLTHSAQQDELWLMARDPDRFGIGWGEAHVLFLEPKTAEQVKRLTDPSQAAMSPRGLLTIRLPGMKQTRDIPVPEERNTMVEIEDTSYRITFKDYFPDFAITEQGLVSRSSQPNNPAVSFVLEGPEGADPYLLFSLHPDFSSMHGFQHKIDAEASYAHEASVSLPPHAVAFVRTPEGKLLAILTSEGADRTVINPVRLNTPYDHPGLGYQFEIVAHAPRARMIQDITNRSDEVKAQALHLIGREGDQTAEAWLSFRGMVELPLGQEPVRVEFRPAQRELPFTVKLLDFRKIDYPGTQMASGFESDVQLTDPQRGVILMRKISMNNPLRYRGYSLYQSSFIDGLTQTTVLSVRNDPGTPFVYTGFLIVIGGVVSMFLLRRAATAAVKPRKSRARTQKAR